MGIVGPRRLIVVSLLGLLVAASPVRARPPVHTVLQDDALLLYTTPVQQERVLALLRWTGVDVVRMTALWSALEPVRGHPDPARWTTLDDAVRLTRAHGMQPMLDLGFAAPDWAGGTRTPDPRAFAAFAARVARRYSGRYRPPGAPGPPLPRVGLLTLWNEPNHPYWLQPQWRDGVPVSPHLYRRMVERAYPAVKRVSPRTTVLVGATAATGDDMGRAARPVPPLRFLRELACVDARLRPLHRSGCEHFRRVPGDGWSHHPYPREPGNPSRPPSPDDVHIADLPRLSRTLDALVRRGRIAPRMRDLWLTESGWESDVPVPIRPWSPLGQARQMAAGEHRALRDPHVRSWGQFLLRDVATLPGFLAAVSGSTVRPTGSWQTGLFYGNWVPKPALPSFRLSLDVTPGAVWGRVRPARRPVTVRLQAGRPWRTVARVRTAADGTFTWRGRTGGRAWRYLWTPPGARSEPSPSYG